MSEELTTRGELDTIADDARARWIEAMEAELEGSPAEDCALPGTLAWNDNNDALDADETA